MRSVTALKSFAVLAAVMALFAVAASPAAARELLINKKCVWNKGAFVLRVDWFERDWQIKVTNVGTGGINGTVVYDFNAKPLQTDYITAGQGRCIDLPRIKRKDLGPKVHDIRVVLSVCGAKFRTRVDSWKDWPDNHIECSIFPGAFHQYDGTTPDHYDAVFDPGVTNYLDIWGGLDLMGDLKNPKQIGFGPGGPNGGPEILKMDN